MTTCTFHPEVAATSECAACARGTCEACAVAARGQVWCEPCFASQLRPAGTVRRSPGGAALLSLVVPGLGAIYAGFVPRGLVQFALWGLGLWMAARADGALSFVLTVAWLGFYLWQAIDAHACAREVNRLGRVPSAEEARASGRGPWLPSRIDSSGLGVALMVLGGLMLIVEIGGSVLWLFGWIWPLALIGVGTWIYLRARERSRRPAGEPLA